VNERIRELAARAGFDWALKRSSLYSHDDDKQNLEKFAELIVQECIDIIAPYTVRMSRPGEEYLHTILEIKQHFGVE
jgi:hypothetical protein